MARPRFSRLFRASEDSASSKALRLKAKRIHRLRWESLELRTMMAQDLWTGAGNDLNWQDAKNWSLNAAPDLGRRRDDQRRERGDDPL